MANYNAKQGDNSSVIWKDTFTYKDGSSPNLTGATVEFVMRSATSSTPTIDAVATITNATNPATVSYTPTATDLANAGLFLQYWKVTFQGGQIQRFPTVGYNTVNIEENLESANSTIVDLSDVKDYLNLSASDRTHDAKLMRFITGVQPVVERIVGEVVPKVHTEWYDGGQYWIMLRHRPVLDVIAVSEWRGPIEYTQSEAQDPGHGSIYSVLWEKNGRVVRRSAGGGVIAFPHMPQAIQAIYQTGRDPIPDNIRLGTLELIRANYQPTQQAGRPAFGAQGAGGEDLPPGPAIGFFVPNRVRELLAPHKRAPAIA
jgi:hypothetical protein